MPRRQTRSVCAMRRSNPSRRAKKEAGLLRFARNDGFQNASSDTIIATDQMTTAQSADQIVAVKKSTGRNERKARVFARRPGWTLANANAFHAAYSGQPWWGQRGPSPWP